MHHLRKLAFVLLLLALIVNHQALGQSCVDNDEPFEAVKPGDNGWTKMKTCDGWVSRKSTAWRCFNVAGATENCPSTCANCCEDTSGTFTLLGNGKTKSCAWAAVNPGMRCRKAPTRQLCSVTCGICAGTTPAPTPAPTPTLESLLLNLAANMFGECATNQSCDNTAANSAVTWFINTDNHPNDLDVAVYNERFYTERLVLAVLFYEMGGDQWNRSENWLSNNHHRTWYNVGTDSSPYNAYVLILNLAYNSLNGTIPTQIGQLTSLEDLNICCNDALTGPIPTEVGQLTSLKTLDFNNNVFTGPIPTEVGQLTSLEKLDFTGYSLVFGSIPTEVGLTGPIPTEVGQLTSLKRLLLSNNALTGSIPEVVGQLTSLKRLLLSDNALTGSIPEVVCDLSALLALVADCVNCNLSKEGCCTGSCV